MVVSQITSPLEQRQVTQGLGDHTALSNMIIPLAVHCPFFPGNGKWETAVKQLKLKENQQHSLKTLERSTAILFSF